MKNGHSSLPECDLTRAVIDVFVLKFGSELSGEIVHFNDDRANAGNEKVVTKHRGDGDAEGRHRGDERAGDARRHGDEAGRTGFCHTGARVHDAPNWTGQSRNWKSAN